MEEYPEELRTPPVALAALVGCPELHAQITAYLHGEQPPINTLALPDVSKIAVIARTSKDNSGPVGQARSVGGILKRDWLLKHRTRVPAVVAALFSSDHVSGDPAQWLQVCTDLENLKAAVRGRNSKLVVVVVSQSSSKEDLSEDRMIALRKRAEVDTKYTIVFCPNDPSEYKQSLKRLATIFAELALIYYRDEGRRVKARLEKKNLSSMEFYVCYCFKVAVYAEFRRDWVEALKLYEDGYHTLREMVGTSTRLPPIQRLVEIKAIAEQLHFKIATLLLHGGKIVEAITWFRQHKNSYEKLTGAADAIFLHWEWLSRQFLVFAELLETSSVIMQNVAYTVPGTADKPTEWEYNPAYYYELAAQYLKEKSSCLELALSMSEDNDKNDGTAESLGASVYIGQFARLFKQKETLIMQPLSDEEYFHYTLVERKRFQDSFEIIALFKRSFDAYTNLKASRMAGYCGVQLGREYVAVNDFTNAKQIFDSVTSLYRQEGWGTLLWEVLGYLRECSRSITSVKDFVEYSLEMAALPVSTNFTTQSLKDCGRSGPATLAQREAIHKEVLEVVRRESRVSSNEENNNLRVTVDNPLYLEIDLVSPLRVVILASVAFHEQTVKPGTPTMITLSLRSRLPLNIEIDQLELQFNQSECNFVIVNDRRPQSALISHLPPGRRIETAPAVELATNKWLRLTYDISSDQSGKLECMYVIARIGPHFTICCTAESPATMNDLPLWKFEEYLETIPIKDIGLAYSGQKAIQVEEPDPQVDLTLGCSGSALVGESFILPVLVSSKGHAVHSGELKINLVDTKGGGLLSPRDVVEPFSTENLHVELIGISGQDCCDQPQVGPDNIQKIQPSFGLISVPLLNEGESWPCKLKIKWNRPKSIMLYVSLGYFPSSNGNSSQKVHVHKSLQIEGKIALMIDHRFMLPFRRDHLLLSKTKGAPGPDRMPSLPLKETSILIASARNCSEVPLHLLSVDFEVEDGNKCSVQHKDAEHAKPPLLGPGDEFKKVFRVIPELAVSSLTIGTLSLRWTRNLGHGEDCGSVESHVSTKYRLPDVTVELPPIVMSLECPPHAVLGNPFTYCVKIHNQTQFLQEIKYSLSDSQSFVLSGFHNDTISVLPKSEHVLHYKLVPLASGFQQLPRVSLTSVRYSAGFQPSAAVSTIFVFPTEPLFNGSEMEEARPETITAK